MSNLEGLQARNLVLSETLAGLRLRSCERRLKIDKIRLTECNMQRETLETTAAALGSKATYAGSTTSIVGWLMSNEFAVVSGMVLGLAGLVINWYYKRKSDLRVAAYKALEDERAEIEHRLKVQQMQLNIAQAVERERERT